MRFLIAIPVFNEEAYLAEVLAEVRQYADEILVIDDGSTDRTSEILSGARDVYRIGHLENRGYGQSLISAFEFAVRQEFDWLITMDCDRQHEPARIPAFMRRAGRTEAEIISGSRYLGVEPGDNPAPPDRREINRYITDLLNETLGLGITDAFCGFKAYRVGALKKLNITVPGYAMPLQLWVQVARESMRVVEIPVRLIYHDPDRHFGGMLDDPDVRLTHYLEVLVRELAQFVGSAGGKGSGRSERTGGRIGRSTVKP